MATTEIGEIQVKQRLETRIPNFSDSNHLLTLIKKNKEHLQKFDWAHDINYDKVQRWISSAITSVMHYTNVIVLNDKIVGVISFTLLPGYYRIGYWLDADVTGNGIMHAVIKKLINQLNFRGLPIRAFVNKENKASKSVLLKCGFVQIGEDDANVTYELSAFKLVCSKQQEWVASLDYSERYIFFDSMDPNELVHIYNVIKEILGE